VSGPSSPLPATTRRSLLRSGSLIAAAGGTLLIPAATSYAAPAQQAAGESVLDKWQRTKQANLGVDLTFPPLAYHDPNTNKPTGYLVELVELMMNDVGATPNYVELPFSQLFAALAAGQFDMTGLAVTILPSRALRGWFADFPAFYETIVVVLKPGSTVTRRDQLNDPAARLAVVQGTSQEYSAGLIFPQAQLASFPQQADMINEVASGRADAFVFSEFDVPQALQANPQLQILAGDYLFADANTYFLPTGDMKLKAWVTNWLRYQGTHNVLSGLWNKWVGNDVRSKYKLPVVQVGPGGEAVLQTA
jgi:ABC-type amino acid transport substrate-binding protein